MNPAGSRKAALALAAMHPDDRRWMLAKLPARAQATLAPLIREAGRLLGDRPGLLSSALADEPDQAPVEVPPPDQLIVRLNQCSPAWAARMLAAAAPDHVEIYLAACERACAEAVRRELAGLPEPLPSALAAALARQLVQPGEAA